MGTRNVTIVKLDNKVVATKYCQWDGYPTGQGVELLEFVKNDLDLRKIKKSFRNLNIISEDEAEVIFDKYLDVVNKVGFDYDKRRKVQHEMVPTLTRDTGGADFLRFLQEKPELPLTDHKGNLDYATGKGEMSFGCEYCYELDLDKKTVRIYDGHYKRGNLVETLKFDSIRRSKTLTKRMEKLQAVLDKKWNGDD